MRRIILILLVALSCVPARAQAPGSPEARAAAKELLAILSPAMIGQQASVFIAQVWPQVERAYGGKASPAVLAEVRAEMERSFKEFLVNTLANEAPAFYAKHFSAQELRELAAFYKTPTGAKGLRLMPQVTAEFGGILTPRVQEFTNDLRVRVEAIIAKNGVK